MSQFRFADLLVVLILLTGTPIHSAETSVAPAEDPQMILARARAAAGSIEEQALSLARIAWPAESVSVDHDLRARARQELENYGEDAWPALRVQLRLAPPVLRADIAAAIVGARRRHRHGLPPEFLSALEDALWAGTPDAQRIAMKELSRYRYPPALLPIVDAAQADPRLQRPAILALGRMNDDRAAAFLGEFLDRGPDIERRLAAQSLAQIGGRSLDVLRLATRSATKAVRTEAVRALVPIAGLDDLTVLHEFVGQHPDDGTEVVNPARDRVMFLESLLEAQQSQATVPGPN